MESQQRRLDRATQECDGPVAAVDLAAYDANADDLLRRAAGTPIRVASKSVRCRALLRRVLDRPGFAGVLAFTVAEACWLAGGDSAWDEPVSTDVVVAYPSAERHAIAALAADPALAGRVTLMVDSREGVDLLRDLIGPSPNAPLRVALDLDAALRPAESVTGDRLHLGPRRSPVRTPDQAVALAGEVVGDDRFRLVGLMAYEGQVAGLPDRGAGLVGRARAAAVRTVKRLSVGELARRRGEVVAAVRQVADLEFVNGGGTGSVETTVADASVTEVAAGSGLYAPALFDGYDAFAARPAAFVGFDVVRRPGPGLVTVAGGGWIASGPPGHEREPVPTYPAGLTLTANEGAGEVQTPLSGAAADRLRIGDRVWFRHAKAGELCERVDRLRLIDEDGIRETVPTYRGEGRTFL